MTTYYASTQGSDGGNGSASSPWRTISKAMEANLRPGDEVVVRPGTYEEAIDITKDGSAAGNITLRSEVPGAALIRPPSDAWNAISVNANYITIDGFDIGGAKGDGIEANDVHHIQVLNNKVHGSGESGIQFNGSDFIRIEGNETYSNASTGWFSGISIYQNRNITGDMSTTEFRTIVRNNISYDNVTKTGQHTDGNGIIIDDFQSTQADGYPSYTFPTLVENNLVYENGGKGIQVTWSDYVTVRNNTAYHNNQDPLNSGTWRGELSNAMSSNNTWVNNIAVADPRLNGNNTAIDNTSTEGYRNANVVWYNNLTYNGTPGQASVNTDGGNAMPSAANGNQLGIDPRFVAAANGDFHLSTTSTAIDAGTDRYGLASVDLDGDNRAQGTIDIGSYEGASGKPTPPDPTPTTTYVGTSSDDIMPRSTQSNAGNEIFKALAGNDILKGGAGADLLDGGSGADTATYAGSYASVTVNLKTGKATGGDAAGDKFDSIENLTGSSFNDVLTGDGGNNVINGGTGADLLDGGSGTDTATYAGSYAGVTVNLKTGKATGGDATGDRFISIENLTGSSYNDVLTGGSGNNVINGGAGRDTMTGGGGADIFTFKSASNAGVGSTRDIITDFQKKTDKIDLFDIDANGSEAANGSFHFQQRENDSFDGLSGALTWKMKDRPGTVNDTTLIRGDLNGDGVPDFEIQLQGLIKLSASDFIL